ncbi:MAG: replication-associated recombination protein A [Parachlamydiales bacterium]|nr:replication-associated recombination protein A [Parachlamydiales bacterium]
MKKIPLSERLRPHQWHHIAGQDHLVGKEGWITRMIKAKTPLSILLYGPPGSGKTTIARLYANAFSLRYYTLSAIFHGVNNIKNIVQEIEKTPLLGNQAILFIDEIHRFNKAQQDAFLPFLEEGTLILIGATTENPSFSLNNALISRLRVLKLNHLTDKDLNEIFCRYEKEIGSLHLDPKAQEYLIQLAGGDARHLLNMIENLEMLGLDKIDLSILVKHLQKKPPIYDKHYDEHYNLISALHKSIRGSDPDAALYWLARMLNGGEDPLFIGRRLIRMATEDIGLADPKALQIAINSWQAYNMLGSPEGELSLAECALYLALAPKSNATYLALNQALQTAQQTAHLPPPNTILNAPTQLMKEFGYGENYIYDHDTKHAFSGQNYFPVEMDRASFYVPKEIGEEREMKKRLEYFAKLRKFKEKELSSSKI